MDTHHLRAVILKLQDRLTNNDRKRFRMFLGDEISQHIQDDPSLGGTLCRMESLFDQDEINEQDLNFLINGFNQIQCIDAVKLLKVHMKRVQANRTTQSLQRLMSIMPNTVEQLHMDLEEDKSAVSIDQENTSASYATITDQKNTDTSYKTITDQRNTYSNNSTTTSTDNIDNDPVPVVAGNPRKAASPSPEPKQLFNIFWTAKKCLIIFVVLSIILLISLIGLIIALILSKSDLRKKELEFCEEQAKNNETIQYLKEVQTKYSDTIRQLGTQAKDKRIIPQSSRQTKDNNTSEQLSTSIKRHEEESQWTEGTTCGCSKWCLDHGSPYGVCGDGPTCLCSKDPITKENVGSGCTCDPWCRRRGHQNGGICGDGDSCICSS